MTGWQIVAVVAVYLIGFVVAAHLVRQFEDKLALDYDNDPALVILFAGTWPIQAVVVVPVLVFFALYKLATVPIRVPAALRRRGADQERIRQLEQALGIERDDQ